MSKIKGIYAASMSVFNSNLGLNIEKTVSHAEQIIDQGCHGAAIFGSTGQAQLISISEKISLLNQLSKSKYKDKYLIGTGLNSLNETINLMSVASSLNFNNFFPPEEVPSGKIVTFLLCKINLEIPSTANEAAFLEPLSMNSISTAVVMRPIIGHLLTSIFDKKVVLKMLPRIIISNQEE